MQERSKRLFPAEISFPIRMQKMTTDLGNIFSYGPSKW